MLTEPGWRSSGAVKLASASDPLGRRGRRRHVVARRCRDRRARRTWPPLVRVAFCPRTYARCAARRGRGRMTSRPLRILLVGDYANDPRLGSAKVAHKLREEFRAAGHECDALVCRRPWHPARRAADSPARRAGARTFGNRSRARAAPIRRRRCRQRRGPLGRRRQTPWAPAIDRNHLPLQWPGASQLQQDARRQPRRADKQAMDSPHLVPGVTPVSSRRGGTNGGSASCPDGGRSAVCSRPGLAVCRSDRRRRTRCLGPISLTGPPAGARGSGALFCGSWDLTKGITYLAAAFSSLAEAGHPVPLTVLGPGVPAAVVMAAFTAAARPHVRVVDRVAEEQVIDEYPTPRPAGIPFDV